MRPLPPADWPMALVVGAPGGMHRWVSTHRGDLDVPSGLWQFWLWVAHRQITRREAAELVLAFPRLSLDALDRFVAFVDGAPPSDYRWRPEVEGWFAGEQAYTGLGMMDSGLSIHAASHLLAALRHDVTGEEMRAALLSLRTRAAA